MLPIKEKQLVEKNREDLKVLIVEDNNELQDFLAELLQAYHFTTAQNGKEALVLLR